jgi:hypothetical protein
MDDLILSDNKNNTKLRDNGINVIDPDLATNSSTNSGTHTAS